MAGTWSVTGDTPDQYDFNGGGQAVVGHVVSFLTGDGNRGSVFVPNDHYNANAVRDMIAVQAAIADQVAALSGEH